jgi:DNA adenine methylase
VTERLRAPFPWFGGKSRAAPLIWEAIGDVRNFVEPFAGSLAVLLSRPHEARIETVNDLDCYLANFWRAVARDPYEVAEWADWPVNEADLHARHKWLVGREDFRQQMRSDPAFYDVRIAGWWAWGLSCWIGGGWCTVEESAWAKRPALTGHSGGRGVHRVPERLPNVDGRGAKGLHGGRLGGEPRRRPSEPGGLVAWFRELAERLRRVRVCCGDWQRVLTPAVLKSHGGCTGVVLDPPYAQALRADNLYAQESDVSSAVRAWAIEHGSDPDLRIVLCGYEGEHEMPSSWRVVEWSTSGGYARGERGKENRHRERLWLSPACLIEQGRLFA